MQQKPSVLSYIHIYSAVLAKADRCPDIILYQPIQWSQSSANNTRVIVRHEDVLFCMERISTW